MGRLPPELVDRIEAFSHRAADLADAVESLGKSRRVVDQIYGAGTSVGANAAEADEAMSRKDFCKCLAIVLKELAELRYWFRFVVHRKWIDESRIAGLSSESAELRKIIGAIIHRTRRNDLSAT